MDEWVSNVCSVQREFSQCHQHGCRCDTRAPPVNWQHGHGPVSSLSEVRERGVCVNDWRPLAVSGHWCVNHTVLNLVFHLLHRFDVRLPGDWIDEYRAKLEWIKENE